MRAYDIIMKKRRSGELSEAETRFLVDGYVGGSIPDYQMSAFLMAAFIRGLTPRETADLTMAMVDSGDRLDLSDIPGVKVDKHSTGGVGDKTTLILGPIAAAAGVKIAKISGRGLGHTGGTLDKLESIPGFTTSVSGNDFIEGVNRVGIVVAGQTDNLVPADKKLYALRDVTATVDSIPLIAASIMSKKIAAGADAIVLDVKTGSGAFMKTTDDSIALARAMVEIGTNVGRRTVAVVTANDQPLGHAIGNALEVEEAILTLRGKGPEDLTELCATLAGQMIFLAGLCPNPQSGRRLALDVVANGGALEALRRMIQNQHGDPKVADDPSLLPKAPRIADIPAPGSGYIHRIDAEELGIAAMMSGAGRARKEDTIDYSAGITLLSKTGDFVRTGEPLARIHAGENVRIDEIMAKIRDAYTLAELPPETPPLIRAVVSSEGVERFGL